MCQYNSTDGNANDWHIMHIGQFVLGGFGLIIAEMTDVNPVGRISLKCAGLYSDDNEKAIKRVIDFAKQYGPSKHGLQIGHAGRKGSTKPPALGGTPLSKEEGAWETLAPSAIPYDPTWHVPRAMTKEEMKSTLDDYVSSVKRAERAGYDLLELHAAHGYLLHQFLSPLSNQRTDEYGGSLEKRMRYPLEVFAAIRAVWPKDKPLGIRVSAVDWVEGGTTDRGLDQICAGAQSARLRLYGRVLGPARFTAENSRSRRISTCRSRKRSRKRPVCRRCRSA